MSALITTLPESVNNDFLYKIGEFYFDLDSSSKSKFTLRVSDEYAVPAPGGLRLAGTPYFTNENNQNLGKSLPNVYGARDVYVSPGKSRVFISPKERLIIFRAVDTDIILPESGFQKTGITQIHIDHLRDYNGEKPDLSIINSPSLLVISNGSVVTKWLKGGNINGLTNIANIQNMALLNQGCELDINAIPASITRARDWRLTGCSCSGNISKFANCDKLSVLEFDSPAVTGVVEDLLDGIYAAGKTTGTFRIYSNGTSVTYGGATFTGSKTFTFTDGGWSLNT